MLLAVRKLLRKQFVVVGQRHQFIHTPLDIVTSHQLVQFFTRIGDRTQHLHLHADGGVLLYLSVGYRDVIDAGIFIF